MAAVTVPLFPLVAEVPWCGTGRPPRELNATLAAIRCQGGASLDEGRSRDHLRRQLRHLSLRGLVRIAGDRVEPVGV